MRARQGHPTNHNLSWPIIGLRVFLGLFVCLPSSASAGPRYSSRIVETKTGSIRGVILELPTKHLEPVEVFRAVPYAQPPTEELRFEKPKRLTSWSGTKLADTFGPVCPQVLPDLTNRTTALLQMPQGRYQFLRKLLPLLGNQSEDCLTLNIYVPGSGNRGLEAPYSVLFFIHGESFEWGSGNPYDGSVLASHGHVIVITVNFRLGILGFLKTRSRDPPGNLGLLDIIAALQWTKENIAAFGGDPGRVTVVGQDTGAALANLILLSKEAKGLMHRTVLLSGSALSPWAVAHDPDALRQEVSQQMACHLAEVGGVDATTRTVANANPTEDITTCLKSKPLEALLGIRLPAVRFMPNWAPYSESPADPDFAMEHSGESFITTQLMLGMNTMESYNDFSSSDIQYGLEEDQRNRILRTFVRNAFTFHLNEIFSAVRNEYTDWDKPIQHPINIRDSTMEALSDGHTIAPLLRVGYLHARRGAKTYIFHFNYQTKDSEYPQRLGSVRGEDVPYVFGLPLVMGLPNFGQNYSRQDLGVAEAVLNFITNFCKTGDPNDAGHRQAYLHPDYGTEKERTRYRGLTWETYEPTTQQYLSISSKPKMKSHYRGHKMAMWLNLIPQLHRPGDAEVSMRHHHFREKEATYYDGAIRAESLIRPRGYYGQEFINSGVQESRQDPKIVDCRPEDTLLLVSDEADELDDVDVDENDFIAVEGDSEEELLQKFMKKHYFSYTAALGVTVGVGCLLLILNVLIFAGIYYQRERSRRKIRLERRSSTAKSGAEEGRTGYPGDPSDIPMVVATSPPPSGHSSGSAVTEAGFSSLTTASTTATGHCRATKQINKNKTSVGDSPPTYSLAQKQQQQQQHFPDGIHLVSAGSGSPSNLHRSSMSTIAPHLYHQQQDQATTNPLGGGGAAADRFEGDNGGVVEVPTCSPRRMHSRRAEDGGDGVPLTTTYNCCSTLGRRTTPHFQDHLHHHNRQNASEFARNQPLAGGSILGIATMRNGQFSTKDLSMGLQMPQMAHQSVSATGNNNAPVLSSILTTTTSTTGGQGERGDQTNSTCTLKKRVQIQEVTI